MDYFFLFIFVLFLFFFICRAKPSEKVVEEEEEEVETEVTVKEEADESGKSKKVRNGERYALLSKKPLLNVAYYHLLFHLGCACYFIIRSDNEEPLARLV